ncbi:histidine kinase [Mucilaginibacter sp. RS28]|uniref:Histidine kinase n=1 Tax=Mucilaginibacter straminoryzae TaxID=2932774 RepID=A0A9X1X527_9SPHI|nr:histidine kinase [Mucilaginibacter straminoryzae]MCJ8208819.1 histidine kinase [Mucilaginibacter straminoryzae]
MKRIILKALNLNGSPYHFTVSPSLSYILLLLLFTFMLVDGTEKKITWYGSMLIALLLNSGRLLALREGGIMARYVHFEPLEFSFQFMAQFLFCYILFRLNLRNSPLDTLRTSNRLLYFTVNSFLALTILFVAGFLQRQLFDQTQPRRLYWATYTARFALSAVLTGILLKIIYLLRASRKQARENEQLKNAYTTAELELLKEQLNPHFLFNSLSSLSGVVAEDAALAQQYIKHLSQVFRYTLAKPAGMLVTLEEELMMIRSFSRLLEMRLEKAFILDMNINAAAAKLRLPHLSLQPLLENAAKHNAATAAKPLVVKVYLEGPYVAVSNNLQRVNAESNGIGLANLNERFRILLKKDIIIEQTTDTFTVKLPLSYE